MKLMQPHATSPAAAGSEDQASIGKRINAKFPPACAFGGTRLLWLQHGSEDTVRSEDVSSDYRALASPGAAPRLTSACVHHLQYRPCFCPHSLV